VLSSSPDGSMKPTARHGRRTEAGATEASAWLTMASV